MCYDPRWIGDARQLETPRIRLGGRRSAITSLVVLDREQAPASFLDGLDHYSPPALAHALDERRKAFVERE
jgi:hypothetical protein